MSIDIVKKLETTDPLDISSRFITSEDVLNFSATTPKTNNVVSFADTASIVQSDNQASTDTFSQIDPEQLDKEQLKTLEEALGYTPNNKEDIIKGIDKTTSDLKKQLYGHKLFFNFDSSDYLVDLDTKFSNSKLQINDTKSLSLSSSSLQNNFSNIISQPNSQTEQSLLNHYNSKNTLIKNILEDKKLKTINNSVNSFFKRTQNLIIATSSEIKSFISDPLSNEYLSEYINKDELKYIQDTINGVLKYATTTCNDMVDLIKTAIFGLSDVLSALNQLLHITIELDAYGLFNDLMRCFDKLKKTINDVSSTNQILNKIKTIGSTPSLTIVSSNKKTDRYNPEKALYNTAKSDSNLTKHKTDYTAFKTEHNIDDRKFVQYNHPELPYEEPVYDITTVKLNSTLSSVVLESEDKESSHNPDFLKNVPLSVMSI